MVSEWYGLSIYMVLSILESSYIVHIQSYAVLMLGSATHIYGCFVIIARPDCHSKLMSGGNVEIALRLSIWNHSLRWG